MDSTATHTCLLKAEAIRKEYGVTVAVDALTLHLQRGTILGLVGANGAGKSTITKVISGVTRPDSGTFEFDGTMVDFSRFSPARAAKLGIRVVHQELSLCKNLTVYENFYIEQSHRFRGVTRWRKLARQYAREALDEIFPGHGIAPDRKVVTLSIAQQQMVEIARAFSDPDLKLLILDEPTSSLPSEQTQQLQDYIRKRQKTGVAFIYISHRLREIISLADRVFIMQNGKEKWQGQAHETSEEDLIQKMSDREIVAAADEAQVKPEKNKDISVTLRNYSSTHLHDISLDMYGGEIVGIAGLEGNGQFELLHELFERRAGRKSGVCVSGSMTYVAGDRKKEGIFPLWSVANNMVISKLAAERLFQVLKGERLDGWVQDWSEKLKVKTAGPAEKITSLSGGNQQKVLIARALLADSDIILLDDPTRGVDIATKQQLYVALREAAQKGKLIIWRTTDDAEFAYCSRIVVMRDGRVSAEFDSKEADAEKLMAVSFSKERKENAALQKGHKHVSPLVIPAVAMILLYALSAMKSPAVLSKFGIELILEGCVPLLFITLSQTFIVGLGHIDLGVAAMMGFCNVVCCSVLYQNTSAGLAILLLIVACYVLMGFLLHKVSIPPIILTMGMSFVWSGLSLTLMSAPGGTTPDWLRALKRIPTPVFSSSIWVAVLFTVIAVLFYRSKYGTVIRGFGNNDVSMTNSGWSRQKAYMTTYGIAGVFALMGGVMFAVSTGAADASACESYDMLTIASVVLGGGYLSGGVVNHFGSVLGAISFSLISIVLGQYRVNNDFTSLIQGFILILALSLRLFRKEVDQ